ncbi:MAG: hypothetical protein ACFFD4_14545 [Candidatus Odinarchaeota archaeon]
MLTRFEAKAAHEISRDEAYQTWMYLRPYLWKDEEEELFSAWEHFRFGRNEQEFPKCIMRIRERMEAGLI